MLIRSRLTWRILQSGPGTPLSVPQDLIPLSSMGFVGPLPLATRTSSVRKVGPCVTSDIIPSPEELRVVTYDVTPSLRESLDQGIPLPPLPRYPEWYLPRAPPSPSPTSSNGIPTDSWETSTQMTSPPRSPSSSPQKRGGKLSGKSRRRSPYKRQRCVPRDPSPPATSDAGEEPSSSAGRGEWRRPSGDGDLEVGVGSGAGDVGSRCARMSGLRVPPSNNEVELLLFFALSSRVSPSPVLE